MNQTAHKSYWYVSNLSNWQNLNKYQINSTAPNQKHDNKQTISRNSKPLINDFESTIEISVYTFHFVTKRTSLILIKNDFIRQSIRRRRFLSEHFLGERRSSEQHTANTERSPSGNGDGGREPTAARWRWTGSGAVESRLEKTVREGDGSGGAVACGGEGSVE